MLCKKEITLEESFEIYLMRANYETMAVKLMGVGNVPRIPFAGWKKCWKMKNWMKSSWTVFVYDNQMHGLLVEMTGGATRLHKAWKELNYGKYCYGLQPEHG